MRCNKTDIYLTRGDTGTFNIEIELESLFEITEVKFTVKKNSESETALIAKEIDDGIILTDEIIVGDKTTWIYLISIDPDDTSTLSFGLYRYDVQIKYEEIGTENEYTLTVIKPSIFGIEEEITTGV